MKKNPGPRISQFNAIDKTPLKSLSQHSYKFTKVSRVGVYIDYHVEVHKHYDSGPIPYKQQLEAHVTGELVQLYNHDELVAVHPRSCGMEVHLKWPTHADSTPKTETTVT